MTGVIEVRNRHLILAAILAAFVFAAGCSSSQDIQQLNQNDFTLRGMIASDRQQIDALNNQVRRLQGEIAELKHSGAAGGEAQGGPAPKDLTDRLSRLESEMSALQAALPTIPPAPTVGGETPPPAVAGTPAAAAAAAAAAPGPASASAAAAAPAAAPVEPSPTWPQELDQQLADTQNSREPGVKLYREGLNAMKSGHYPAAIDKLARVQHNYPKSPLSEPAKYFAANALYENGKYDQSIIQYNDVVMRYPRGQYTCQSLLREGQAFMKLDDKIDARLTLQKLSSSDQCASQQQVANNMLKSLSE